MKEIGGYFGMEQYSGEEYYSDLVAVNTARNALLYILKARSIQKLYIPYFLCSSVAEMCERNGYQYEYYHIGGDFMPIFERDLNSDEYLYVVNFYGQISNYTIGELKQRYDHLILDNVQAFFQRPVPQVDTVYSCRKFFGVPDGGYVSTSARLNYTLPEDCSAERMRHILGRFEGAASDYYSDFKTNDDSFKKLELLSMSKLTHNLLSMIDYDTVKKKREQNYLYLHDRLGSSNRMILQPSEGPYAYPFYCDRGMQIKRLLAEKKIYVATLWPNVLELEGTLEKDYAENILPLPIDQRYGFEEMDYIVQNLKNL